MQLPASNARTRSASRCPLAREPGSACAATERGLSLVEVLAASALLGGVLLSVMSMLSQGQRVVGGGRAMARATALADEVLESFRSRSLRGACEVLDDRDDLTTTAHLSWGSRSNGPDVPEDPGLRALLDGWRDRAQALLPEGEVIVTVRGLGAMRDDPPEAPLGNARVVQLVVTVAWNDRGRTRSVILQTLHT